MKTFFVLFALLATVLAIYPFLDKDNAETSISGLPWQIEIFPDGSSSVFGLQIGHSRLADAYETLGHDMELAIVAAADEVGNVEMYYGHYRAGLLSGKLVLQTNSSPEMISRWRENAIRSEYMASGRAKKYYLSADDITAVLQEVIIGLTFIPAVNLDEAVILARFGEPGQRIQQAGMTHFLYPDKGLDIALSLQAKEVMQYVSPDAFPQFIAPLLAEPLK